MSHPSWVCGLKLNLLIFLQGSSRSHPSWVCGLKHTDVSLLQRIDSHTLRGCVD